MKKIITHEGEEVDEIPGSWFVSNTYCRVFGHDMNVIGHHEKVADLLACRRCGRIATTDG